MTRERIAISVKMDMNNINSSTHHTTRNLFTVEKKEIYMIKNVKLNVTSLIKKLVRRISLNYL